MNEHEESSGTIVELLLLEPAVAWLEDYRPDPDGAADDDAPAAA